MSIHSRDLDDLTFLDDFTVRRDDFEDIIATETLSDLQSFLDIFLKQLRSSFNQCMTIQSSICNICTHVHMYNYVYSKQQQGYNVSVYYIFFLLYANMPEFSSLHKNSSLSTFNLCVLSSLEAS